MLYLDNASVAVFVFPGKRWDVYQELKYASRRANFWTGTWLMGVMMVCKSKISNYLIESACGGPFHKELNKERKNDGNRTKIFLILVRHTSQLSHWDTDIDIRHKPGSFFPERKMFLVPNGVLTAYRVVHPLGCTYLLRYTCKHCP